MQWQEIRNNYPDQWLLVEALAAHTEADKRIPEELAVINAFPDSRQKRKEGSRLRSLTFAFIGVSGYIAARLIQNKRSLLAGAMVASLLTVY